MKKFTAFALTASLAFVSAAQADTLADILTADGVAYDNDQNDFDIVTQAIITCSPDVLAGASNPTATLTAFLPTDKAFRILVEDVFGTYVEDEAAVFGEVATLGCPTIDTVLKYHVAPAVFYAEDVLGLENGAAVPNLAALPLSVTFKGKKGKGQIRLMDNEPMLRDPIVRGFDIEAENGVAHVIDRVLLPVTVIEE